MNPPTQHQIAAIAAYDPPVDQLLSYGALDPKRRPEPWPNYLALGFTEAHGPELIRMATDPGLNALPGEDVAVWAPVHAWRTLGQLRLEAAADPLLRLLADVDDDVWLPGDLPIVLSMIGPASLPALSAFVGDESVDEFDRIVGPECLERIALDHPEMRDDCVRIVVDQLERHETNGHSLNAFLIGCLAELGARDRIELIRAAFAADVVDLTTEGDLEDIEIRLDLRTTRSKPRPRHPLFQALRDREPEQDVPWLAPAGPVRNTNKVGRNEPCPCGSGKKYKKCCLETDRM